MQNCQGVVKQDFQWGCQAGLSWRMSSRDINQNFYIGLASKTAKLDCLAGLGGWTVKENCEAGLWSRTVTENCEAELRSRTMGQDCEGELWSRTVKQYWQTGQWCRTIEQSCQGQLWSTFQNWIFELKALLNYYLLNQVIYWIKLLLWFFLKIFWFPLRVLTGAFDKVVKVWSQDGQVMHKFDGFRYIAHLYTFIFFSLGVQ